VRKPISRRTRPRYQNEERPLASGEPTGAIYHV